MVERTPSHAGFLAELRRRKVLRVLGFYTIGVWLAISIGDIALGALGGPDWLLMAMIVAAIVSFPVVAALAWVFDLTPDGIVRTGPRQSGESYEDFGAALADQPRLWIDIAIIGVLLALIAFLLAKPDPKPAGGDASIAVLPFLDLSEHRDGKYFSDGIAEELLDNLARIPGLRVAARTSSFADMSHLDIPEIGERLGVATVLEGSVRRDGQRVRITAQLIDVATGFHLWSQSYDGTLGDIFVVQNDIARSIAGSMRIRLLPGDDALIVEPATDDMDAYDLYLRGRAALRSAAAEDDVNEAIARFRDALRLDPRFALADAGLCSAYWSRYQLTREAGLVDRALDACRAARLRDDTLPEVHVALGGLYEGLRRYNLAHEAFDQALTLEPGNTDALRGVGVVQMRAGDLEASEQTLRRVVALDPNYWRSYSALGGLLYGLGRLDEAEQVFRRGTVADPSSAALWSNLGGVLVSRGRREAAADAFTASIAVVPTVSAYANAGTNYFFMGRFQEAREMYEHAAEIAPNDYRWHSFIADACRQLPNGTECEVRRLRRAVTAAEEQLGITPGDSELRARLAWMHHRLGDRAAAHRYIESALEGGGDDAEVLRNAALVALADGEVESALDFLEQARERGYSAYQMQMHPEFSSVQAHPRFRALLEGEEGI
ncbi:MAG: tetratricopeptide repeat protein [Xanthomonadaceae bacterium]|nr:tetratricopeptide repeat protein [Xanthomonadaceae bacterium]